LRFGLVGTGYWARVTHGSVLAREPGIDFGAVWGRDADKAAAVGAEFGIDAYSDFDEFLTHTDAVAFAVPPEVQAELGTRAAEAGKHLLLDKPIATSLESAQRLVDAVDRAGVSTVVFFTMRFSETRRQWLASVDQGEWEGGWARWIVSAFAPGSPYASSPWRREKGALWDVGPHALSMLTPALGAVVGVTADAGTGDLVHLVFHHSTGATSTASLTLNAPPAAINVELSLWGPGGVSTLPPDSSSAEDSYQVALRELLGNIDAGEPNHPCDVHFGATIVRTLADAEQQIAAKRSALLS
jgi:predicted dehydrogenase